MISDIESFKMNWINYLYNAKKSWIKTPFMEEYEEKILEKMRKNSLEEIIRY